MFFRKYILNINLLNDLLFKIDLSKEIIIIGENYNPPRFVKQIIDINRENNLDLCYLFEDWVENVFHDLVFVRGMNCLRYEKDMFFSKHNDYMEGKHSYTVNTLLYQSVDFSGGDFLLNGNKISLNVGESILFPSTCEHEITPVITGERIALASWLK